jgi:hypothetical protein
LKRSGCRIDDVLFLFYELTRVRKLPRLRAIARIIGTPVAIFGYGDRGWA